MENSEDLTFLTENITEIKERVASAQLTSPNKTQEVTLVAVSKTKPASYISHLFSQGQIHFGENYVEEYIQKQKDLDQSIKWHFIGHLQSNKVAKILESNIHVLETLDSEKLAEKLDRGIKSRNLEPLNVFLQVKMSEEETKHGILGLENAVNLAKRIKSEFTGLNLIGLMCIGKYGDTSVFPVSLNFVLKVLIV